MLQPPVQGVPGLQRGAGAETAYNGAIKAMTHAADIQLFRIPRLLFDDSALLNIISNSPYDFICCFLTESLNLYATKFLFRLTGAIPNFICPLLYSNDKALGHVINQDPN